MATHRDAQFPDRDYVEPASMPKDVPSLPELGVTSAPLKSAAFFLGAFCKDYNDDFMLCKAENRDPAHCLPEGRRVTRCGQDLISKLMGNCADTFNKHWQCLEQNNQHYQACRKQESKFNACVFEKLELKKEIPGTPEGAVPIHEKASPIYTRIQR